MQVVLFKSTENEAGELTPLSLVRVTEWNHNHFVTNLTIDGEYILVGDAISSNGDGGGGRLDSSVDTVRVMLEGVTDSIALGRIDEGMRTTGAKRPEEEEIS